MSDIFSYSKKLNDRYESLEINRDIISTYLRRIVHRIECATRICYNKFKSENRSQYAVIFQDQWHMKYYFMFLSSK